jgi:hypothetical protein
MAVGILACLDTIEDCPRFYRTKQETSALARVDTHHPRS